MTNNRTDGSATLAAVALFALLLAGCATIRTGSHGWAEKTITERDRRNPSAAIDQGVSQLFETFPR